MSAYMYHILIHYVHCPYVIEIVWILLEIIWQSYETHFEYVRTIWSQNVMQTNEHIGFVLSASQSTKFILSILISMDSLVTCQLSNYGLVDGIVGVTKFNRTFQFFVNSIVSVFWCNWWTKFRQTSFMCCIECYGQYYRPWW